MPGLDSPEASKKTVKIIIRSISIPFVSNECNRLPLINIKMTDIDQTSRILITAFRSKNLIAGPPSILPELLQVLQSQPMALFLYP